MFVFYTFGFIIWHAHLARWGVSAPSLFKIEFFSASLCYFTIVLSIALPAALLWARCPHGRANEFLSDRGTPLYALLLLTGFLLGQVASLFFPRNGGELSKLWALVMAVPIVHFPAAFYLHKRRPELRVTKILWSNLWFPAYLLALNLHGLMMSERTNGFFVVSTLMLYVMATSINGWFPDLDRHWRTFPPQMKALVLLCLGFVLIGHARQFGRDQFAQIPQAVGGGEPLRALFIFEPAHSSLPLLLDLRPSPQPNIFTNAPMATNLPTTNATTVRTSQTNLTGAVTTLSQAPNAVFGPVQILMRSEKEVVFYVEASPGQTTKPEAKMIKIDSLLAIKFLKRN